MGHLGRFLISIMVRALIWVDFVSVLWWGTSFGSISYQCYGEGPHLGRFHISIMVRASNSYCLDAQEITNNKLFPHHRSFIWKIPLSQMSFPYPQLVIDVDLPWKLIVCPHCGSYSIGVYITPQSNWYHGTIHQCYQVTMFFNVGI